MPINYAAGIKLIPLTEIHKHPGQSLIAIAKAGGDVVIFKNGKPLIRIDKITDLTGELDSMCQSSMPAFKIEKSAPQFLNVINEGKRSVENNATSSGCTDTLVKGMAVNGLSSSIAVNPARQGE